jgi:hypothetical protein
MLAIEHEPHMRALKRHVQRPHLHLIALGHRAERPSSTTKETPMNGIQKTLAGVAALAALGLGGSAIATATSHSSASSDGGDGPDQQVTGSAARQAGDAAVAAVPGGKLASVEAADEAGPTAYEVKVTDPSGKLIEVGVSKTFTVTHQNADDDPAEAHGSDHETADDHGSADADGERGPSGQHESGAESQSGPSDRHESGNTGQDGSSEHESGDNEHADAPATTAGATQ